MMDMGPYYITALVNLMGRVTETVSMAKASFPTRTITAKERFGETIQVDVNTYVDGLMRFESGAAARMFATFDAWYPHAPGMEIYGSEGTLFAPDPNTFGGAIRIFRKDRTEEEIPLSFGFSTNSRGLGLWDMCDAIRNHRAPARRVSSDAARAGRDDGSGRGRRAHDHIALPPAAAASGGRGKHGED